MFFAERIMECYNMKTLQNYNFQVLWICVSGLWVVHKSDSGANYIKRFILETSYCQISKYT